MVINLTHDTNVAMQECNDRWVQVGDIILGREQRDVLLHLTAWLTDLIIICMKVRIIC